MSNLRHATVLQCSAEYILHPLPVVALGAHLLVAELVLLAVQHQLLRSLAYWFWWWQASWRQLCQVWKPHRVEGEHHSLGACLAWRPLRTPQVLLKCLLNHLRQLPASHIAVSSLTKGKTFCHVQVSATNMRSHCRKAHLYLLFASII